MKAVGCCERTYENARRTVGVVGMNVVQGQSKAHISCLPELLDDVEDGVEGDNK